MFRFNSKQIMSGLAGACLAGLLLALPVARAAEKGESAADGVVTVHVLSADYLKAERRPTTPTAEMPSAFIRAASMRSTLLVQLAALAERRSQNEQVSGFAERLGVRHGAWASELARLAKARGVKIPNELTAREIAVVDHLTETVKLDFDQDYLWHTIGLLRRAVEAAAGESTGSDAELSGFAASALPELKSQLAEAVKIGQALLKSGEAGYSKSQDYDDPNAGREPAAPRTVTIEREVKAGTPPLRPEDAQPAEEAPADDDTPATSAPAVKM